MYDPSKDNFGHVCGYYNNMTAKRADEVVSTLPH